MIHPFERKKRSPARIAYGLSAAVLLFNGLRTSDVHGTPCGTAVADPRQDAGAPAPTVFAISVRDVPYGAKGDAKTDDTTAIQRALDDAGRAFASNPNTVATVFLPSGVYLVRSHLTVPAGVKLVGVLRSVSDGDSFSGSVLNAVADANNADGVPFITLDAHSTLRGLTVFYPNQIDEPNPVAYPWAVRVAGEQVSVIDVMLTNPWQGIDLASHATAGHLLRRVSGQPIHTGVIVDHSTGGGRIEDIHFWPFWKVAGTTPTRQSSMTSGTAFEFRFAAGEVVEGVLELGYQTGMRFTKSPAASCTTGLPCGGSSGRMTNINFDTTGVSLDVSTTDAEGWTIDGMVAVGILGTYPMGIWHRAPLSAKMTVTNASFFGGRMTPEGKWVGLYQVVRWDGAGDITLSNSTLTRQNPNEPAIDVRAGSAMLDGNFFGENVGVAISASGGASVKATGNQMIGNTVTGPVTMIANAM